MNNENVEWLDIPSVLPCPISKPEFAALTDMFNSPGWSVFMKIKRVDVTKSAEVAMSLVADEMERAMNRATYHAQVSDLTFAERLIEGARNADRVDEQQAMSERDLGPYQFVPIGKKNNGDKTLDK